MAFRIQGRITDCGKVIRFEQTNAGVPAALGFDVVLKSSYLKDRLLEFECCLQHWSQSYFGPQIVKILTPTNSEREGFQQRKT